MALLRNISKIPKPLASLYNAYSRPTPNHCYLHSASARHSQISGAKISYNSTSWMPKTQKTSRLFSIAQKEELSLDGIQADRVSKDDKPPPFTLKDQDGKAVSLSDFKGKPVVLYFYPADDSPGCTKEACAFRDSYEKFKDAGAEVVGVSADSIESHKDFANKYRLPFTLLSDEENKVRKEWGIPGDIFGSIPGRQTYVIDKNGVIQLVYNNQFQPEKHIQETLSLLQSL